MRALDTPPPTPHQPSRHGQQGAHSVSSERLPRRDGPTLEILIARPKARQEGAPVLFVHGAFAGAWCWGETYLPAFAEAGRYAAAVSLRGHGRSGGRVEVWRAGMAELLADLRHAIGTMPGSPVLVAHSIGGLMAQWLIGQVPLRGLVLVGSLPPEGLGLICPSLAWSGWAAGMAALCESGPDRSPVQHRLIFGDDMPAADARAYAARLGAGSLVAVAEACIPRPVVPAFAAGLPTLVLTGSDDTIIDPVTASRTALYHGAEYGLLAGAGHFPMLGPAAEVGSRAMLAWLARHRI